MGTTTVQIQTLAMNLDQKFPDQNYNGKEQYAKMADNPRYVNQTAYLIDSPQEHNNTVTHTRMHYSSDPPPKTRDQLWKERVDVMKAKEAKFEKERQ